MSSAAKPTTTGPATTKAQETTSSPLRLLASLALVPLALLVPAACGRDEEPSATSPSGTGTTAAEGSRQRVEVTVTDDGHVVEDTYDWYAPDKLRNVWYLGETRRSSTRGR
jgi:hypothetical protein